MEVSQVRKQVQATIEAARERAQQHRQRSADAERAFATFLEAIATPMARQVASALKAEGYAFTVGTPGGGLRLAAERGRDDFIDIALDTSSPQPQVVGRISYSRGSRTLDEERPLKPGVGPESLTEQDVLEFFLGALGPWLER